MTRRYSYRIDVGFADRGTKPGSLVDRGAENFGADPELCDALLKVARHEDSRKCFILLAEILDTPDSRIGCCRSSRRKRHDLGGSLSCLFHRWICLESDLRARRILPSRIASCSRGSRPRPCRSWARRPPARAPINFSTITAFLAWFGGVGYLLTRFSGVGFGWLSLLRSSAVSSGPRLFSFLACSARPRKALDAADYEMIGMLGQLTSAIRESGTGEMASRQPASPQRTGSKRGRDCDCKRHRRCRYEYERESRTCGDGTI